MKLPASLTIVLLVALLVCSIQVVSGMDASRGVNRNQGENSAKILKEQMEKLIEEQEKTKEELLRVTQKLDEREQELVAMGTEQIISQEEAANRRNEWLCKVEELSSVLKRKQGLDSRVGYLLFAAFFILTLGLSILYWCYPRLFVLEPSKEPRDADQQPILFPSVNNRTSSKTPSKAPTLRSPDVVLSVSSYWMGLATTWATMTVL